MRKAILAALAVILWGGAFALAVTPQKWTFRTYDDFLRGRFDGVSVSAEGILTLSPREDRIEGPTEDFYLSFLATPEGISYLGTGHEGKIYRIAKDGKADVYFQTGEMDVTCLAADKKGILYAGTSPNGKIYKIEGQTKGSVFFDPAEKYVWDLVFEDDGNLLAAVGESGGIYEVGPAGEGREIFKSRENHVLALVLDRNKNIIAGTGGNGLIYRIAKGGKSAVIFESPFDEVRSLALDLDGNVYAASGGTSTRTRREELSVPSPGRETDVVVSVSSAAGAQSAAQMVQSAPQAKPPLQIPSGAAREPGALFRIGPDGLATRLWSSSEEMIYSLFWNETEKRVYFGAGPRGRLYSIDAEGTATLILQKSSEQIYALVPVGVRTYVIADNPAQLSVLYPEQRLEGEYTSSVLDAKIVSTWGRVSWEAELPLGAVLQVQSRSGNSFEPGSSWSDWSPPYQKKEGEQVLSPKARFLQFRALFKAQSGKATPAFSKAGVFYLQANVAPSVKRLDALPPNEVFLKPPEQEEVILGLEKVGGAEAMKKDEALRFMVPKKVERQGYQTVTWEADDDNGDSLSSTVSIRREGEKDWRMLEEDWTETLWTFNTRNFQDGIYFVKVTASDRTSNPPDLAKTGEKTSVALTIDNTAPLLRSVQALREGGQLSVSFQAEDALSAVKEVKYLVRPDDWRVLFPEDGICDSRQEGFKFRVALDPRADKSITITVTDAAGNTAVVTQAF